MDLGLLLTFGYVHEAERQCSLSNVIPDGIAHLIHDHYYAMSMYECEFVETVPFNSYAQKNKNAKPPYDYLFKTVQLGERRVGKSALLLRFAEDLFSENEYTMTIGIEFKIKTIKFEGDIIKLQLWDEPVGKERFRAISRSYYRGAHGIFVVFDVADSASFEFAGKVLEDIIADGTINEDVVKLLIGNKCDLKEQRQISVERAKEFASQWNMQYIECSAKTGYNVHHAFLVMVGQILRLKQNVRTQEQNKLTLPSQGRHCYIL